MQFGYRIWQCNCIHFPFTFDCSSKCAIKILKTNSMNYQLNNKRKRERWLTQSRNLPVLSKFLYLAMTGFRAETRPVWPLPFWPRIARNKSCFQFALLDLPLSRTCWMSSHLLIVLFNYISHLWAEFWGFNVLPQTQRYRKYWGNN